MSENDFAEDPWPKATDEALEVPPALPDDTTVPLHLLDEGGDDNVRTSASKVEIAALAASILHRGVLQALVVAKIGDRYKVGAGNRRLRALKLLLKQGAIARDYPVRVTFAAAGDLHEISLTENVMRVQLHPVDEFEAFRDLVDSGTTVSAIADRFGLKERQVRQRLALGGLAAEVRKAWRDGKIGQEQAEGFTITDDHDLQRAALAAGLANKHGGWPSWEVDRILRAGRDSVHSGTMNFVGRDVYLAAGGLLREDLFGDVLLIESPHTLERLREEKLDRIKAELSAKGWSFVLEDGEVESHWSWPRLPLEPWMTPEEKSQFAGGRNHRLYSLEKEIILRASEDPAARAQSGVFIEINNRGEVELDLLRVRQPPAQDGETLGEEHDTGSPADKQDEAQEQPKPGRDPAPEPEQETSGLSKLLLEDLTGTLGDVIAECLVLDPDLALRAAVASLGSSRWGSPVRLIPDGAPGRRIHHEATFAPRLLALAGSSREQLMALLAVALAQAIETRSSQEGQDPKLDAGRKALIAAIDPDAFRSAMRKQFKPAEFFERAPGAVAKAAAAECGAGLIKGKKAELVQRAAELARETGWLPEPLRGPHYLVPGDPA